MHVKGRGVGQKTYSIKEEISKKCHLLCIGLYVKMNGRQPNHVTSRSSDPPMAVTVTGIMVMVVKVSM